MDRKILQSLRVGDTVQIHFTHMAASGERAKPFNVVIAGFNHLGKAYKEDDGQYYESRQISWHWANMPVELQPDECVRDDIRGLDGCHEDHISALIKRGPYIVEAKPRNVLYTVEESAFADHLKIEAYRRAKGERISEFERRHTSPTGYVFNVWNETYERNIAKNQYNGHIFKLAETLIARRPALAVSGRLDADRFYAAWNKVGRPGYVGPFVHIPERYRWTQDEEDAVDKKPSLYNALVNKKAFTNWVVRNISRFVMTKATQLKNQIQAAADEEQWMRREYGDA